VGIGSVVAAVHPRKGTALPSLLVIIPALNEEETVAAVVRGALDHLDADILVVDDGSHDRTAIAAAAAGATVLRHPFNLGVGAALRTGFRYAADQGYQVVAQVDADGQHEVTDAKRLVELVTNGEADLAVGSRFGSMSRTGIPATSQRIRFFRSAKA